MAQVKKNQAVLLANCQDIIFCKQAVCEKKEVQKAHGRVEQRHYKAYKIEIEDL